MPTPTELIDDLIAQTPDWRGALLGKLRQLIHDADPEITEEWKWMGAPVFSHGGIVCVMGIFKGKVKLTFYDGASLPDPGKLFNAALDGNKWRAIDFHEGDKINESALRTLICAGVEYNLAKVKPAQAAKR
jgi:hypothetical protein